MRLFDPTSQVQERRLFRALPLASLEGRSIGILENNKLNAEAMLREIATQFEVHHGCRVLKVYSKSNASAPAPAETLAKAAREVDFLLTGLGD